MIAPLKDDPKNRLRAQDIHKIDEKPIRLLICRT